MTHTTIEKEKLEKVLEALEYLQRQYSIYPNSFWDWSKGRKAITTVKQALAAPVKEPLTWLKTIETPGGFGKFVEAKPNEKGAKPVYLAPPAAQPAVPLTDDTRRLDALAKNSWDLRCFDMSDDDIGWRVIEHHMAKPHERTVAEVFRDDPRQAIDAAIEAAAPEKGQP
jgi:hypothetical protein